MLENYTLALQNTPKIEAYDFVSQIKPKVESSTKSISTHATRVNEHVFSNSLAPRKQASINICELNNLKYATPASQSPVDTYLALQNINKSKQLIQIRNKVALAQRESQNYPSHYTPIISHSTNISKSHHPKLKSVFLPLATLQFSRIFRNLKTQI